MVPHVAFRPSISTLSAVAPELVGCATCPLCHAADPAMTNVAVSAGADWQCARCGQRWDTTRLATVAAYAVWLFEHTDLSGNYATTAGGDV